MTLKPVQSRWIGHCQHNMQIMRKSGNSDSDTEATGQATVTTYPLTFKPDWVCDMKAKGNCTAKSHQGIGSQIISGIDSDYFSDVFMVLSKLFVDKHLDSQILIVRYCLWQMPSTKFSFSSSKSICKNSESL